MEKLPINLISHQTQKLKCIIDLNVKATTIKLFGGNIGVNLHDLGLSNGSLDMTPKAMK